MEPEFKAANGFLWNPETQEALLHLRDGNTPEMPYKWSFFGGRMEGDETPAQGFCREISEELSIAADPKDAVFLRESVMPNHAGVPFTQYSFYMESQMPKSEMTLTEGADFGWFSLDEALELDLAEYARLGLELFRQKVV